MKKIILRKSILTSIILIFSLFSFFSLVSCSDDNEPATQHKPGTPNSEGDTPVTYEQFEGYMFVLDQSQKPTLGEGYEAERNVPPAKLMSISREYSFTNDILKENASDINLGFESNLQKVGDYFIVLSHYKGIKEDNLPSKITVIRAKDLHKEREVEYMLDEYAYTDFMFAVSDKKVIYGLYDSEIHILDLETKNTTTQNMPYDRHAVTVDQEGYILMGKGQVISKLDSDKFTEQAKINLPENINDVYLLNDNYVLATTSKGKEKKGYLISASEMKEITQFNLPKDASVKDLVYDKKGNQVFVPGKGNQKKNEVYRLKLNQENASFELFYRIPEKDINMSPSCPASGNIRLGIHPETRDLYIANIADYVIISSRNTRTGRITRISLKEEKPLPIVQADKVEKIDDMYSFSPFFYLNPSKKAKQ